LEDQKAARLGEVAVRAADLAATVGAGSTQAKEFLAHYFRHVDADDVAARSVEDLLGLVAAHYRLALERPSVTSRVHAFTPRTGEDGWSAQGATVVQIVTDDKPFLVATVTMEVLRQGWSVREIFHPQFIVTRDVTGQLRGVLHTAEAEGNAEAVNESWIHLELRPGDRHSGLDELVAGLHRVLRDVEEAVADWEKMHAKAAEIAATLDGQEAAFVEWMTGDNFTFLGYRHYRVGEGEPLSYEPVPGTGLGILRADADAENAFHAIDPGATPAERLVITKDNFRATVHRPAYLDYIGIRTFDQDGRLTGEHRFLGLFGALAYSESVTRLPVLREKARQVLRASGYDSASHGGKAIMAVLDNFPRDEMFQSDVGLLGEHVERIARLKDRREVRLFARRDAFGRFWSCLVYIPRDRYTTAVRSRVQQLLCDLIGGEADDFTVQVSESTLARLHLVVRAPLGSVVPDLDVAAAEEALTQATRTWNDGFSDELASQEADPGYARLAALLPEGYKENNTPRQAIQDLTALDATRPPADGQPAHLEFALYVPDDPADAADLRFKVFARGTALSLSQVLPHLTVLGVEVVDERPYEVTTPDRAADDVAPRAHIYDFGLRVPGGSDAVARDWSSPARQRFRAAFAASWSGAADADGFQRLIMGAGIDWQQAAVLRAVGRYLQQAGTTYSQAYLATTLAAHPQLVAKLTELFALTFDPARNLDLADRDRLTNELADEVVADLREVSSLDHDRILRSYLRVMRAMVRTNAYRSDRGALAFKLLPRRISGLPEPRPAYEIFVCSPRVEGVHLRFGAVARGGLRWSDRAEDYRTEVLGLVKAQMVKNTVIVPVGAKGGFYCRHLPDPSVDRDAWLAEGQACYRIFINALLDVTDNIVASDAGESIEPPTDVVRHDGDDAYLVVAADKGTATFSDLANEIATSRGFWLGDAFASGGSAGYDHKGMGITARGAWVSVQRHFRDMGIDCQTEDFTCVGIGDMSGDVFGNGMLLSEHTRLVAAFDHRHVFVDPDPDAAAGFAERRRLFDLPRSSWDDYDRGLISEGGGVFDRRAKEIAVTPQMRTALGLGDEVPEVLSPAELISAILQAPVDLLWNGGIGTYVKASEETSAEVGDRANDVVRVNGSQVRARCVGEGGNLGFTQRGRIEYAAAGGRINTDFIDNSAGVDTSDHEVNIKILLAPQVRSGALPLADRDALLASMTDEVAGLVLRHNYDQNLAIANALHQALSMAGVHEDWMHTLEELGQLDRTIESLPSSQVLAQRRAAGTGLTAPEIATLLAYTKIVFAEQVLATDLPDEAWLADRLVHYFPGALQARGTEQMPAHPLHREIITTVVVNEFVNSAGITMAHRLGVESGASVPEVIRAHLAARAIFGAAELDARLAALDNRVPSSMQTTMRLEIRTLVERATRWLINNRRAPIDIGATVAEFTGPVDEVRALLPSLLVGREADRFTERRDRFGAAGIPADLAEAVAVLPEAYAALGITENAASTGESLARVTEAHVLLGERIGLDQVLAAIIDLPRNDRWQTMARAALRDDLHTLHADLTARVLTAAQPVGEGRTIDHHGMDVAAVVAGWQDAHGDELAAAAGQLDQIMDENPDLARMSVALRIVRSVVAQA